MLLQLNIYNFALIEKLSISFKGGFNVLSGETGAGKSIIIDAINYVLGSKFNKDLIRSGEQKTYVEAIFSLENPKTLLLLQELEIEYDDIIIISRESFQNGKSIVKVNGKSVILSSLKNISSTLIDIHGQHENQNLLEASNHINYLDDFSDRDFDIKKKDYEKSYRELNDIIKKIEDIKGKEDREKLINYLEYQINDIDSANLDPDEEKNLEERFNILSNAEKISKSINIAYGVLNDSDENFTSTKDLINSALKELRNIEKHSEKINTLAEQLQSIGFSMEDIILELRGIKEDIIYDDNELEKINARLYKIADYKKKYGKTIDEILQYRDNIKNQFEEITNSEEILKELELKKENLMKILEKKAAIIHELRKKTAKILKSKIKVELDYIGLEKSNFDISIEYTDSFNIDGKDKVQFLISTNPGEPLKPLEKIISGGELSRIMLALKTIFVDNDKIPTVIFDEIDTGISGRIAQRVAEKMYLISKAHQVFCITHLPQIASMSDNHFLVYKTISNNKTYTKLTSLTTKEKEIEVAKMIGGIEVTEVTLKNSREIINLADKSKETLS
ncbi:DNA repair protein RecN [Clostridium algidicarnis]|uniref:DNA repair protein RecN n=1 Tax=Clostridium algidicarnis TaxID=37659 RepID=UPI0016273C91|nr:DNA repair protein RecN [Clostridium algidicarnis]MBB6631290.1 DNA repair protein RecN [Clostridium algidicarnis]